MSARGEYDPKSARSLIGKNLEIQPIYGWGWSPRYPWSDLPAEALPPRSALVLSDLWDHEGAIIGGLGKIEASENSPLLNLWVRFCLRHVGKFDFDSNVGDSNLFFYSSPPPWPIENIASEATLIGFGFVGIIGFQLQHGEHERPPTTPQQHL